MKTQYGFTLKLSLLLLLGLLSACDTKSSENKINPLADHTEALNKAKNVETQLLEQHNKAFEKVN